MFSERSRQAPGYDAIAPVVRALLVALGFSPEQDEGLAGTPDRCMRAWQEMVSGYDRVAEEVLGTTFPGEGYDSVVVLKDVSFVSVCEHHLMTFTGKASVAYLPQSRVVGLSKMARLVDMHARRLQVQERMTIDIAKDLERVLKPLGVAVVVRAVHSCMEFRGVRKAGTEMVTSSMLGRFRTNIEARQEVLALMGRK